MPTSQKKPVDCSELAASLAELALAHGEAGVNTLDGVVDAIRRDLPEVDRDTIADAIVAYSRRPRPEVNPDSIKGRIAELKRVARRDTELRKQIDTLKQKSEAAAARPKDKKMYDERISKLEKERDDLQKSISKEKTEARTADKIAAEIEDLQEQLSTGEFKDAEPKAKRVYSDKIEALRKERADVKGKIATVKSGARKAESKIKAEEKTVELLAARIDDLAEQLETGEFKSRPATEKKMYSDRVQALRDERDALQKNVAKAKSEAKTEAQITAEIEDLRKQRASGEFKDRAPSEKKKYSDKITALREERAKIRKDIAGEKYDAGYAERLAAEIEDLQEQLSTGILKEAGPREKKIYSDKIEALRQQRKDLKKTAGAVKTEGRTAARIEAEIEDLRAQIKSGEFKSKPAAERRQYSDRITALREERSALAKEKNAITGEKRFEESLKAQIADLERQMKTGDFTLPKPRAEKAYGDHIEEIRFRRDKLRKEINQEIEKKKPKGLFHDVLEAPFNEFRALMTTGEFSAVGRQGGFFAFGQIIDPRVTGKQMGEMFKAFSSERTAHKIDQSLRTGNDNSRPNARLYERAGLHLPDPEIVDNPRRSEESFQTDLPVTKAVSRLTHIPVDKLVHGSGRAYITFLNLQRADKFDAMAAGLSKNGEPDIKEAKAIAKFINVATGRGNIGEMEKAVKVLNTMFFAPRYVASRFQLLGEPIRALGATALSKAGVKRMDDKKSMFGGTRATDKKIALEYAKYALGVSAVLGLAAALPGVEIESSPYSTDFGKIKIGNTRLDPFSGLQQVTVFLAKQAMAKSKSTQTGEVDDMDARAWLENAMRFGRGKLSPLVGTALDLKLRKDVVGNQVDPLRSPKEAAQFAGKLLLPITWKDIYKTLRSDYGLPDKAAITLIAMLGGGIQSYDPGLPQPPDDRFPTPDGERETSPGLGSTIHLNDEEYAELMQAHEEAIAEIQKERAAGAFDGMTKKEANEEQKAIYDDIFAPAKKGVMSDAINRLDP